MSVQKFLCRLVVLLVLAAGTVTAAEKIEIKYLVRSNDTKELEALKTELGLKDRGAAKMTIYFFETKKLHLIGQGLALRLRKKDGKWETTVKERPATKTIIKNGQG